MIEFASPGESIPDLQPRISDYLDAGVQCVWCIWVEMNQIHICTSAAKCVILSIGDELTGAPFIPGFRMPVADLFSHLDEGVTVDEFLDWFPAVTAEQVHAVLSFTRRSLDVPVAAA